MNIFSNHIKIKIIISLIVISYIIMPVTASTQTWVGVGFVSQRDKIPEENKEYYQNISSKIESLNLLGPDLEISFFPYFKVPLGIKISNSLLFPIGYNSGYRYHSYQGDLKNITSISLEYSQNITNKTGLYFNLGYQYNLFRFSKDNTPSIINREGYYIFDDNRLFIDIGILTNIENAYFKLGLNYAHSLNNNSYSIDLILSGGYKFK